MAKKSQNKKTHPLFGFVDETGITKNPKQPNLGLGLLVIQQQPLVLNQVLREVFLRAIHDMKVIEERFEFKFTYITHNSLPYYRDIVETLITYLDYWQFTAIQSKRNNQTFWSHYLSLLQDLLNYQVNQPLVVLADHLNKPKKEKLGLSSLIHKNPNLTNILQIESQGSVLLQVTDVLLGAINYQKTNGKDKLKTEIAALTIAMLETKTGAGIDPIYATPNNHKDNSK